MSRHTVSTLLAVIAASILLPAAHGAPLTVSESTDFPSSGFPSQGTLDIGLNTISGMVHGRNTDGDLTDTFSVTLPAGLSISSASFVVTGFAYSNTTPGTSSPRRIDGSLVDPVGGTTAITANGTYNLTANLPFSSSGAMQVTIKSPYTIDGGDIWKGLYSYSLKYTVIDPNAVSPTASAVPLPAAFPGGLMLLGLAAVARWLPRRRNAANP